MQAKVSIPFYAKRAKATTGGLIPIYLRVTIDGQRIEISTKRYVEAIKWVVAQGRMKGNSGEAHSVNTYLDILKDKVYDYQEELVHEGKPITAETMRNKLLGTEIKSRMLVPIFENHNKQVDTLVGDEFAPGTLERYKISLKHTVDFLQWKYNVSDKDIKKLDHAFVADYELYLRSVRKCTNNTAVKYIKNFGKIIRICIANGWLDKNPFVNFKSKVKEVERAFPVQEEIQAIADKEFSMGSLTQVKAIIQLNCFTGWGYIDVKQLARINIGLGIDSGKWI